MEYLKLRAIRVCVTVVSLVLMSGLQAVLMLSGSERGVAGQFHRAGLLAFVLGSAVLLLLEAAPRIRTRFGDWCANTPQRVWAAGVMLGLAAHVWVVVPDMGSFANPRAGLLAAGVVVGSLGSGGVLWLVWLSWARWRGLHC